jgi:ribosome maturation factor RimP
MVINDLAQLLEATVSSFGLDLVDYELSNRGRTLRLFIDRPGARVDDPLSGITVGDCELVTKQLQRVLPVEGIDYDRLEVSSPGLDRVVKRPADFMKFAGLYAEIRMRLPIDGRRRFSGVLRGIEEQTVLFEADETLLRFALADIERARLAPELRSPAAAKRTTSKGKTKRSNSKPRQKIAADERVDDAGSGGGLENIGVGENTTPQRIAGEKRT